MNRARSLATSSRFEPPIRQITTPEDGQGRLQDLELYKRYLQSQQQATEATIRKLKDKKTPDELNRHSAAIGRREVLRRRLNFSVEQQKKTRSAIDKNRFEDSKKNISTILALKIIILNITRSETLKSKVFVEGGLVV